MSLEKSSCRNIPFFEILIRDRKLRCTLVVYLRFSFFIFPSFTSRLENWAVSFGSVLWETARVATRFDAVKEVSLLMSLIERSIGKKALDRIIQLSFAEIP